MKIKICGINDEAGLQAAQQAGADFFGLVVAPESPRFVDLATAKHLLSIADKKIKPVLLLVNPALDEATYLIKECNPYAVQLHGEESPDLCLAIKNQTQKKIIKAIPIADKDDLKATKDYEDAIDYFLFDTKLNKTIDKNINRRGGLGRVFDWLILGDYHGATPFFLAGGLTPDNVGTAIKQTNSLNNNLYGVDVSSGVEESVGKKSPAKIKKFCRAARV